MKNKIFKHEDKQKMKNEISNLNLNDFLMLAVEVLKTTQKGSREAIKYVYSDDEKLVVTDGCILVTMDKTTENIAPGFYNVAKIGKELTLIPASYEGKYPNYKMVIPKYSSKPLAMVFTKKEYMPNLIKLQDMTIKYCGGYVAEEYFELLKKSEFTYKVIVPINQCGEDERHPVLFKSNKLTFVVMPKSINK